MRNQYREHINQQCAGCRGRGWIEDELDTTKKCIICGGDGIVPRPPKPFAKQDSWLGGIPLPFAAEGDYGRFLFIGLVLVLGFCAVNYYFGLFTYQSTP